MLIAVEGPDCSGKTALFKALRPYLPQAVFVPKLPMPKTLSEHRLYESTVVAWRDPRAVYVCDRFFAVSEHVYARYRAREVHATPLVTDLHVLLLEAPAWLLSERARAVGHEPMDFSLLRDLYRACVMGIEHRIIDASGSHAETLAQALSWLTSWGAIHAGSSTVHGQA